MPVNYPEKPHPLIFAIESNNLNEVQKIIGEDPSVLKRLKDSKNRTPIFHAIRWGNSEIVKAIIEKDPSVLEEKDSTGDTPISYAIKWGRSEIAKAIVNNMNEDSSVLKQEDSGGKTPIFNAVNFKNVEIVEAIIEKYPSVLGEKNSKGMTPISYAAKRSIRDSGDDKVSKVLQTILDHQFKGHIDKAIQEDFKELFLKEMLLKGIYSAEKSPFSFNVLEKAFDKITPESTFNKIYQDLFKNVDKNQPITSTKKENTYIFQSKLRGHSSFFIFHVNKKDGKLTSISYCDGNAIDEGRKIEGSTTHINSVTTFKLNAPIEFSPEFAKNFIKENTENKKKEEFYKKFIEKTIAIEGAKIDYAETTHSIPTKKQIRGNCAFKSPSLVVRFISHQQNPKTMVYGFDPKTKKPNGNGHHEYKEFKINLTKNALVSIIETKEKISSKSGPFSNYVKEKIEDTVKIVGAHNKRKLIPIPEEKSNEFRSVKRRKLSTKGIHNEIAAILKNNESPNESLSPLTNQPSPLSTNMTDRSHK